MAKQLPNNSELPPLSRRQILIAMAVTAVVLLIIAKLWMRFYQIPMLPVSLAIDNLLLGAALGVGISISSGIVYRFWTKYRQSADLYLELVLKPLTFLDLIWLGLLPGMSEELLFRGVMLPAFGLNILGLSISSVCFGVLHLSGKHQWPYVVWATIIGFVLGFSALATGNLLVPIVAHIITNLISGSLWKLDNR
ncbi:MAG: CPBP family intramembrane metalloprotease [Coleofasciculaceae cyanobacterium SM2_1_6]|nr:CPBP family intramembrane metalloprotease [Coleofasciculaceae cyanobacterium SM2_1_6]